MILLNILIVKMDLTRDIVSKIMDFDDMQIEMGGPLSPAVFKPLNDESFLYLLLPLRG